MSFGRKDRYNRRRENNWGMIMYIEQSLKKYLNDLADKKPIPGGGSASALASSLGTALMSMVCNFTMGKKKYKNVEQEVKEFFEEIEVLRSRLMELIDLDIVAYEKVNQIQKLVKGNKRECEKTLQEAIKEAVKVPLEICQLSVKALKICKDLVDKTNINLISDLSVSANLLKAGFLSALVNIEANLSLLKDKEFIVKIQQVIDPLIEENKILPDLIQETIVEKMKVKKNESKVIRREKNS